MRPRQDITEIFSTFVQFEGDRFSNWIADPKLRRSMHNCLLKLSDTATSENFWVLYWYKLWQKPAASLAKDHLLAYLQETCYWTTQKTIISLVSLPYQLSDCFQVAIASVDKVLKGFKPDQRANLKTYAAVAFGNIIKDELRLRQEVDRCNDWGLLHKLSKKQLLESLQSSGLSNQIIARYQLAWSCFEATNFPKQGSGIRKITKPDRATWEAIAKLYNSQSSTSESKCSPETLEQWLTRCASIARTYLYPGLKSLNIAKSGEMSGELQDDLADTLDESLLAQMITQEESQERQKQQTQMNSFLVFALEQLDSTQQKLMQLYYQQGLTQQQIAKELEIQQYQVSRKLTKTRELLLLALTRWSQETLHISLTSNVVKYISPVLEEWLQDYYIKR